MYPNDLLLKIVGELFVENYIMRDYLDQNRVPNGKIELGREENENPEPDIAAHERGGGTPSTEDVEKK